MLKLTKTLSPDMKVLWYRPIGIDTIGAVCGSETNCTLARTLIRQIENKTLVRIYQTYILLGTEEHLYKFSLSNKALDCVKMNDRDQLELEKPVILKGEMIGQPRKRNKMTEEQKENLRNRIKLGRAKGLYKSDNIRRMAAIRAGKLGKKLRTQQERELDGE